MPVPQPVIAHVGTDPSVLIDSVLELTVLSVQVAEKDAQLAVFGLVVLSCQFPKSPDVAPSIRKAHKRSDRALARPSPVRRSMKENESL
jgi:hypothetical protein